MRENDTVVGHVRWADQRCGAVRQESGVRLAGVEALETAGERRLRRDLCLGGERLVVGVVTDDPWVVLELVGDRLPRQVVLALEVADDVVAPEVRSRGLQLCVGIVVRPTAALGHDRDVVRAHGPVGCALTAEEGVVDVLVHIEEGVDAVVAE